MQFSGNVAARVLKMSRSEPERTDPQGEEVQKPPGWLQGAVSYGHDATAFGSGIRER